MSTTTIDLPVPSAGASTATAAPPVPRAVWLGFAVVLASAVMDLLDSTIAQTAAPAIRRALGGSYATIEWTSAAYTLAMATTLLVGGRLGDVLGRRRALLGGIAAFVVASALCALAPSPSALIVARAVQGLTAAVLLAMAGGFALVYPLVQGRELGWPLWCAALPVAGVALLAAFWRIQARRVGRGAAPLVEPSVLRRRPYVSGLALVICFIGAMGGMGLALTVMFQTGLGFAPLACGVAMVAIPLAAIAGSIASSALLGRLGRTVLWIGLTTMGAGVAAADLVLRARGAGLSAWDLAAPLTVTGFGMGMIFVPMFDVILAGVEPHQLGSASGLLEAVQQLAMSLGIAVVGTVLFDVVGARRGPAAFVGAADHALLVCVGLLAAAAATVAWLPRHARAAAHAG